MHLRRLVAVGILLAANASFGATSPSPAVQLNIQAAPLAPPPPSSTITLSCPAHKSEAEKCNWADLINAAAWPLVATLALIGLAALSTIPSFRGALARTTRRVTKLKGGPLELEFSPEAAKDLKASIDTDLKAFQGAAAIEYDRQARGLDLEQRLRLAVSAIDQCIASMQDKKYRATVHVPDVVLDGYLYQLLDYQPDETGRGRRWSERFGILGRAWRLRQSMYTNHALGTSKNKPSREEAIRELVQSWGMNVQEAERSVGGQRQSFLCVLLRVSTRQVGVLYLDASEQNVFEDAAKHKDVERLEINPSLETLSEVVDLAKAVDKAMEALRTGGTYLHF